MTAANQLAGYASSLPNFRNRFINGDQVVDQRNGGSAGTASANTLTYATDRWYIYSVGATCGYQRVAGPNTSDYAIQITPASSNTNSIVAQRIENLNCLDLSSQTVTISGKVYIDNSTGVTFNTNVYVASSANSSYGSLVSFSSTLTSGQYVDFSGTVTLGANAINGIEVDFSFLSAAGKTIKLTNLQLEIGTIATPFEHRPTSVELSLCQRYFQSVAMFGLFVFPYHTTLAFVPLPLFVPLRSKSAVTLSKTARIIRVTTPAVVDYWIDGGNNFTSGGDWAHNMYIDNRANRDGTLSNLGLRINKSGSTNFPDQEPLQITGVGTNSSNTDFDGVGGYFEIESEL